MHNVLRMVMLEPKNASSLRKKNELFSTQAASLDLH